MKTIFRQSIEITDVQWITAPWLGRVVAVDNRRADGPEIWYEVEPGRPDLSIQVWVVGTGNPIPDECVKYGYYVGHILSHGGVFVWHIYASTIHHEVRS